MVAWQLLHLNSIMILLIQPHAVRAKACDQQFKFHYDSINSQDME